MSRVLASPLPRNRIAAGAAIAAVCMLTIGWSLNLGKDLNWDQLNYHFYSAYSFLNGRLLQDFMAANLQSYLNPLPYLPFYGMVRQGWHSVAITAVLACFHALNIVLAYLIAKEISGEAGSTLQALIGAALAFLSPIFLLEAGTTFADISTAVLVLLAMLLALRQKSKATWWRHCAFLAGLAGGAAAGLKLTNAVYAPALAAMVLVMPLPGGGRLRAIVLLALGGLIGAIVTHGYWSYLLWHEFKNPFFPLLNAWFASPDYPLINHQHERFLPGGLLDVLRFPVDAISTRERVYVESSSPDLRYASLVLLASIAAVAAIRRRIRARPSEPIASRFVAFTVFMLVAYIFWMWTSGNGRYGLVISVLIGPMIAAWASHIFSNKKYALTFLIALIVLQTIHLQHGRYRWLTGNWTETWYDESVPQELKREPHLFLSVGRQSHSFVAPFLSPQSAFINPIGQMSIDLEGPGGDRIERLLKKYAGRVRVITRIPMHEGHQDSKEILVKKYNALLSRFHMVVDAEQCLIIKTDRRLKGPPAGDDAVEGSTYELVTCALNPIQPDEVLLDERRSVETVVSKIISWCPKWFKPAYSVIERLNDGWYAEFEDSDTRIEIRNTIVFVQQEELHRVTRLGHVADWESDRARQDCFPLSGAPRGRVDDWITN